jgi:hypothetical protein
MGPGVSVVVEFEPAEAELLVDAELENPRSSTRKSPSELA